MTRSGNRRRRPPHSASAAAPPHPPSPDHQRPAGDSMDSARDPPPDTGDPSLSGSAPRADGGDAALTSSSDRRLDSGDRQASGHFSDGGERRHANGAGHPQRRSDGSEKARKDGNEQRGSESGHHRRTHSRDRPPYYQHYQKNQRWEGKENSDQKKDASPFEAGKEQEYTPYMASRAKDLKEEGNRRFQRKDFLGAMDQYELALKLTPANHPDRAVFHSNRAACLMQMKPPQHEAAIHECNLALEVHPGFSRALLRRARAYEAVGKLEPALQDVELLLQGDVSHPDALDMAKRIRLSMDHQGDEAQQDLQGRPSTPSPLPRSKSYAGRHNAESSDVATQYSSSKSFSAHNVSNGASASVDHNASAPATMTATPSGQSFGEMQSPQVTSQPLPPSWPTQVFPPPPASKVATHAREAFAPQTPPMDSSRVDLSEKIIHQDNAQCSNCETSAVVSSMRPLKLIYDHDIRLAEMPANCKFSELRKLVKGKFPSSKAILMKYKDVEGDLVTITSTEELRLAEAAAAVDSARQNLRVGSISSDACLTHDRRPNSAIGLPVVPSVLDQLRLHVVEVPAEQEPHDKEHAIATSGQKASHSDSAAKEQQASTSREREFDKWLLEFAHLFRNHLGIDPSGHVDFHELGLELCAEALEETITTEEAHKLFQQAGCKFQEMVAVGYLNWGNVHMCAARKEVPQDNEGDYQMDFFERLQAVFDWAHAQYCLAEEKFRLSLQVKPDFCDGMLGLGHKDFESAKLNWALAIASQKDLKVWESSKTLELFHGAAGHAKEAAEVLAKREESRGEDLGVLGSVGTHQKKLEHQQETTLKEQIYLFWGHVLYEHSQVEFRLGLQSWNQLLDDALLKFEIAGVSPSDISMAVCKHLSSSHTFAGGGQETVMKDSSVVEDERVVETEVYDDSEVMQIETVCKESLTIHVATEDAENTDGESDWAHLYDSTEFGKNTYGEPPFAHLDNATEHGDNARGESTCVPLHEHTGENAIKESRCEVYEQGDGFSNPSKNLQGELCDMDRMPVDNVSGDGATASIDVMLPHEDVVEVSMVTS